MTLRQEKREHALMMTLRRSFLFAMSSSVHEHSSLASGKKRACTDDDIAKIVPLCKGFEDTFLTTCIECRERSMHYRSQTFEEAIKDCLLKNVSISNECGKKRVTGTKNCTITCTRTCYNSLC